MKINKKILLGGLLVICFSNDILGNEIGLENKTEVKQVQIENINKEVYKNIRVKWSNYLTGIKYIDSMEEEEREEYILSLENSVENFIKSMQKDTTYIFKELEDVKDAVFLYSLYNKIKTLAIAYNLPQTEYYKDENLKEIILFSLKHLGENYYFEGAMENGNWWQWEIGIPKSLNDIVTLMYDEIPAKEREKYLKTSQYFQPYAEYSGSSPSAKVSSNPNKRVSTGGNRLDTAIISFIRGVLMEDATQVFDGVNSVAETGEYVKSGDGFYVDGSFIQHDTIAYNGTYASVLFGGLGQILYLSKGTPFEINAKELNNIYDVVINGYSYLFINGGIIDSVSGRAIARDDSSDITRGREIVTNLALISEGAPKEYRDKIKSLIKMVIEENNSEIQPESVRNLTLRNIIKDIRNNKNIEKEEVEGVKIFSAMDRAIYKTEKNGKFGLSLHSKRVGNYERINGENIKGWHTGDGMTYIYGIDSSAMIDYWATVDMYHLSGTTESIKKREDGSGSRQWFGQTAPNSWAGGTTNGEVGLIGMDFYSWNDKTRAKKTWIFVDDMMIALGSNVSSSDGEIHTTLDQRIIKDDLSNEVKIENGFIELKGNMTGESFVYKTLDSSKVIIKKEMRKGSWKEVGGKNPAEIERGYFTAYINHGENPKDAKYMYAVMPMTTMEEAKEYDWEAIEIKRLDNKVHHIKKKEYTFINVWDKGEEKVDRFKISSEISLISKEEKDGLSLWIADPTQLSKGINLEILGEYKLKDSTSENIKVNVEKGNTKLEIATDNLGQTIFIELDKK